MSQVLAISAIDFCRPKKMHELENSTLQALPVSSYKLPNGTHQIISLYSDDIWRLEDARFPTNTIDSDKKIRFNTIPSQFVEAVKFALKHYDIKQKTAGSTLCNTFKNLKPFFHYLDSIGVESASEISSLLCANYVNEHKQAITQKGKMLSKGTLHNRFKAIEILYRNLKGTKWAFEHPWVDGSSKYLAGVTGQGKKNAKTQVISDKELKVLINHCNEVLKQANELIQLQAEIDLEREALALSDEYISHVLSNRLLKPRGYSGLAEFYTLYNDIPDSVAIIILAFSGIRIHELCSIQFDAYRVEDDEDEVYYWLKSHSSKTYEGYSEWLVPEIVIKAIEVQKNFIKPFQERLWQEQAELLAKDPHDPRGLKIEVFKAPSVFNQLNAERKSN